MPVLDSIQSTPEVREIHILKPNHFSSVRVSETPN